jgi:hypothetical protein
MTIDEGIEHLRAIIQGAEQHSGGGYVMQVHSDTERRGATIRLCGHEGPRGRILNVKKATRESGWLVLARFEADEVVAFCREAIQRLEEGRTTEQ